MIRDTFADATHTAHASVALLGEDYPGVRIRADVAQDDLVAQGQILFHDAGQPAIKFVSPLRGRVSALSYGPRRTLAILVIDPDDGGPDPQVNLPKPGDDVRARLLAGGLWPAFVARPFGGPPDADARPAAIVVSAVASSPVAPDPERVLEGRWAEFEAGMDGLTTLTDGPVHLCLASGTEIEGLSTARISTHRRRPGRKWRTAGAQMARVHPLPPGAQVWTIGYQDVIAAGHFLMTGSFDPFRTITTHRPEWDIPREVRVPLGVNLDRLLWKGERVKPGWCLRSGSALHGRRAGYLGRHHEEASIARDHEQPHGSTAKPLIPLGSLDRALPFDVPAVPLMRALSIGDAEVCGKLGCLDLLEEDVAPLTAICTSGTDYGRCLRDVLDQIRMEGAPCS